MKITLKKSGKIIINLKESLEDTQAWKGMIVRDFEREYFIKNETNHTFRTIIEKVGLENDKELMSGGYTVYILKSNDEN